MSFTHTVLLFYDDYSICRNIILLLVQNLHVNKICCGHVCFQRRKVKRHRRNIKYRNCDWIVRYKRMLLKYIIIKVIWSNCHMILFQYPNNCGSPTERFKNNFQFWNIPGIIDHADLLNKTSHRNTCSDSAVSL